MSVIADLNSRMPSVIDVTKEQYEAWFGSIEFTPNDPIEISSDFQCGAIANELEYAKGFMDYITRSQTIDAFNGEYLDKVVYFFTGLTRNYAESDEYFRNRFKALCVRRNNPNWMTVWMIRDVFSYFFDISIIYVVENYVTDNWISDESIEEGLSNWIINQSGVTIVDFVDHDQFDLGSCVEFRIDSSGSLGSVEQTFPDPVPIGYYMLSFWIKDDGNLTLSDDIAKVHLRRSGDGYYYDWASQTWQASISYWNIPKTTESRYEIRQAFVVNDIEDDLTLVIENIEGTTETHTFWVDYIEFGTKVNWSRVKLVLISEGGSTDFTSLWEGTVDPIPSLDYEIASYLDQSFIEGFGGISTLDYLSNLFNAVKPFGVESAIQIVNRFVS